MCSVDSPGWPCYFPYASKNAWRDHPSFRSDGNEQRKSPGRYREARRHPRAGPTRHTREAGSATGTAEPSKTAAAQGGRIIVLLWWEKWSGRLDHELQTLDAAGIHWTIDQESQRRGVMRLHLTATVEDTEVALVATFPESYPYFRAELTAPELELPHHQNPFAKNLCLLGRRTHYWDTDVTVAEVLRERLPLVLRAGVADSKEQAAGIEQQQGEPFSNYYTYAPSMIIVQSDWSIPSEHRYGRFAVATDAPPGQRPATAVRGVMTKLFGEKGEVIAEADAAFNAAFLGRELKGVWVRRQSPIVANDGTFINEVVASLPPHMVAQPYHVADGWLRIWGVLFPEEVAHRSNGDGWVFACGFDKQRPQVNRLNFTKRQANKKSSKSRKRKKR